LFHASVLDNICYGRRRDMDEAVAAAKQANADAFVRELPQGYDTDVGTHGTLLSGGQRQRLCIARALVRNPKCLVLDEPTASLDSESEMVVVATLRSLLQKRDRIVVIVTHHLALMEHVDEVALVEKGQLVEFGSHQELLERSVAYQRHFNLI
jgi:ABC-type multidrug transport system fused ATPase/permease subunit